MSAQKFRSYLPALLILSLVATAGAQQGIEPRLDRLLSKMTLEEKVGQMAQITLDVVGSGKDRRSNPEPFALDPAKLRRVLVEYHVGSILNTANDRARDRDAWHRIVGGIQAMATQQTRLGIPVLYGIDAIHGTNYTSGATLFPQQIGQAATFNRSLVRRGAEITAYETRASGIPWVFSPVLDLGADPRFPRQFESFGEDPFLGSEMAKEMIDGYEGKDNSVSHPEKVAVSLKHFLGYQVPLSGRDRTPASISDRALREYHLPAFQAAIEAGAHTVMINSGIINGIPVHSNADILTRLLKQELGFQGFAVSDWADIDNLRDRDRIAGDGKEAVMIAVNAGIDMAMLPYDYDRFCADLIQLVKEGKVKPARIDDAVRRILRVKMKLGLFEKPVTDPKAYPAFGSKAFEEAAYRTAAESITLLKNRGNILPLAPGVKVLVAGPNANSMRALNGGWSYSWQGEKAGEFTARYHTVVKAFQDRLGAGKVTWIPGVSYRQGGKYHEEAPDRMDEALAAAGRSDVVILCLGENSYTESPGNLDDLHLSDLQVELARRLAATGKPIILILNEGRPRLISRFENLMSAVLQAYLPGNFGGDAIADIVLGKLNPSGRLPYTYPRHPNALIPYYHKPSEGGSPMDSENGNPDAFNPQFQFGSGLSYTTFAYENLKLGADTLRAGKRLSISVDVRNSGKREGKEAVLLFVSDLVGEGITPDVKRLRGFEKIHLKAGETRTVAFSIGPEDIASINLANRKETGPGAFKVQIGEKSALFQMAAK